MLQVPNDHNGHLLIDNNLQDTCNNHRPSTQTRNPVERNSVDELQVSFYVSYLLAVRLRHTTQTNVKIFSSKITISVNLLSSILGSYFIY